MNNQNLQILMLLVGRYGMPQFAYIDEPTGTLLLTWYTTIGNLSIRLGTSFEFVLDRQFGTSIEELDKLVKELLDKKKEAEQASSKEGAN
jgi:hypothetical protein